MKIAIIGFHFCCRTGKRNRLVWEEYARLYPKEEIHIYTGNKYLWDNWIEDIDHKPLSNLYIHQIPIWFSKWGQFGYAFPTIILELFKLRPDIVYASEEPIHPFVSWICATYAKIKKNPFFFFTYENKVRRWYFPISLFESICVKKAKKIVCATTKAAEVLINKYGISKSKVRIFPETGINLRLFKKNIKRNFRGDVVLYVGRFIPEKGIKEIIAAKKILESQGNNYNWLLIGSGPLKLYIKSKGGKNIKILPWLDQNILPKYYNKAKIFVYPSLKTEKWEEQFGYSIVESLACGTPVITTPNAGALGIIPEKEMIVPFADPKAIASKIVKMMRTKKEVNYEEHIKNKFGLEAIAKKWHSTFFNSGEKYARDLYKS